MLQVTEGATTIPPHQNNILYQTKRSDSSWTSYDQVSWNGESKCCKTGVIGSKSILFSLKIHLDDSLKCHYCFISLTISIHTVHLHSIHLNSSQADKSSPKITLAIQCYNSTEHKSRSEFLVIFILAV